MKVEDLRTTVATLGTEANIGSAVPQNMRRFIYRIKAINLYNGTNLISIGKREDGAISTTWIDYLELTTQYETQTDPEALKDDSAPLYIIEGGGSTGDSYLRAVAGGGASSAYFTIWYIDAPAEP